MSRYTRYGIWGVGLLAVAASGSVLSAQLFARQATAAYGIPVLVYHGVLDTHVAPAPGQVYVSREVFDQEMAYLAEHGYTVITFEEAVRRYALGDVAAHESLVVITFDDGYENQHSVALPILERSGFKATFFINSGHVGKRGYMTWDEIRHLADSGMEIGGHTTNHVHPRTLSDDALYREIAEDKWVIESHLDRPIAIYAHPFGEFDERVRALLDDVGYAGARSANPDRTEASIFAIPAVVLGNDFEDFRAALE